MTLIRFILVVTTLLFTLTASAEPVNINTATPAELAALDGIGPKKADAIYKYREEHGPFPSIEALADVPGIGPKLLERNKDNMIVGDGEPAPEATAVPAAKTE